MIVAKTDRAHQGLSEQFASHGRDGRLEREYLAVVWRVPERRRGTIDASLARSATNRQKIVVSKSAAARTAITHYDVEEKFVDLASVLRCRLETGRTHQIRVHLAHIGHPVLGDPAYGKGFSASRSGLTEEARDALAALGRQALHATVLGFEHLSPARNCASSVRLPPTCSVSLKACANRAASALDKPQRRRC